MKAVRRRYTQSGRLLLQRSDTSMKVNWNSIPQKVIKRLYGDKVEPPPEFRHLNWKFHILLITLIISGLIIDVGLAIQNEIETSPLIFSLWIRFGVIFILLKLARYIQRTPYRRSNWARYIGFLSLFMVSAIVVTGEQSKYFHGVNSCLACLSYLFVVRKTIYYDVPIFVWVSIFTTIVLILGMIAQQQASLAYKAEILILIVVIVLLWVQNSQIQKKLLSSMRSFAQWKVYQKDKRPEERESDGIYSDYDRIISTLETHLTFIKETAKFPIYFTASPQLFKAAADLEWVSERLLLGGELQRINLERISEEQGIKRTDQLFLKHHFLPNQSDSESTKTGSKPSVTLRSLNKIPQPDFKVLTIQEKLNPCGKLQEKLESFGYKWNFNAFKIYEYTQKDISITSGIIYKKLEIAEQLNFDAQKLACFYERLEKSYKKIPFHNSRHACDVTHSMMFLLNHSRLSRQLSILEVNAVLIASYGHDVAHPGFLASYLVDTKDPIAIRYNDLNVLENLHSAVTFKLLQEEKWNFLASLSTDDWNETRKWVLQLILESDSYSNGARICQLRRKIQLKQTKRTHRLEHAIIALTLANVGYNARKWSVNQKWTTLKYDELFAQGDLELSKGLPISPGWNRETVEVHVETRALFNTIIIPFVESWCEFENSEDLRQELITNIQVNEYKWKIRHASCLNSSFEYEEKPIYQGHPENTMIATSEPKDTFF